MRKALFLCSYSLLILSFLNLSCTADKEETIIDLCGIENISFSLDIEPVLDASCINCHNSVNANAGIALDSYEDAKDAANSGQLLGSVKHEPGYSKMPPSGKLDSCEIVRIEEWIDKGLPE
ncbi:MAG: hypothetical protein JSV22_03980 [Bacteroidales bacterium]|nr:MAG: hypothetical protein JSV22_03980 [Bacteroidales bacterium]